MLEQTRDALNAGDYDALRGQVLESLGLVDATAVFARHMVDERNAEWLPRLGAILNDGHAVVVVGAMHFPGSYGVDRASARAGICGRRDQVAGGGDRRHALTYCQLLEQLRSVSLLHQEGHSLLVE